MMPPEKNPSLPKEKERLVSVDALRGFDMLWIIGAERLVEALAQLGGGPVVSFFANQLTHVTWEGFRFFDGIFPLFLFLVGVSIVLSMDRTIQKEGKAGAIKRVFRRSLLLFVVGILYYGGFSKAWPDIQLAGVLQRIALCYFIAGSLYVLLPRKGILLAILACLIGYWGIMNYVPFPDVSITSPSAGKKGTQATAKPPEFFLAGVTAKTRGVYEEGKNLAHYIDLVCLPGKKRNLYYTNEGLLSTIPAVASTLFGIVAGWILTSASLSNKRKAAYLVFGGVGGIIAGLIWGLEFPIIKRIWTSSFCLLSSGFSAVALGLFYLTIDVYGWKRWCTPFLWIGSNAITAYLAVNIIDFDLIASRLVGGDIKRFLDTAVAQGVGGLVLALVSLTLPILLLRFMYQRKLFIRL